MKKKSDLASPSDRIKFLEYGKMSGSVSKSYNIIKYILYTVILIIITYILFKTL